MVKKLRTIGRMLAHFGRYLRFKLYCKLHHPDNSKVWLLSERGTDARDNAWHFYRYLKDKHPEIKVKYVITPDSADRHKIQPADRVAYGSKEHYILFLTAGKLISTHIMGYSPDMALFQRLYKYKLLHLPGQKVFLQHGITQSFIPSLTKKVADLGLFICGAQPEYDFILQNFGYDQSIVKYTGFARYDALKDQAKRQILVMPTFRRSLNYTADFTKSEYFRRWNSLLNNPKLIQYLEETKTDLLFYPHYEVQQHLQDFNSTSKRVKLADFAHYDVQTLLKESSLLITDYSSVFFDFAYLGKPVLYYQFDYADFRANQYAEGYFDYHTMGFGPVAKTEADLVKQIIQPPKMAAYQKRVQQFFRLQDHRNCERIYQAIVTGDQS